MTSKQRHRQSKKDTANGVATQEAAMRDLAKDRSRPPPDWSLDPSKLPKRPPGRRP